MVSPVIQASLVTILPAMGALFWFLRRYEGYFEDARVFFSLIVGFFLGLAAAAFEFLVFRFGDADYRILAGEWSSFLSFVIGYAFFEAGIKTMVLGMGRFKGRRDTPYYGAALGLGFGAMVALMIIANAIRISEENGNPYSLVSFLWFSLIPIGAIFAHGATGAYVGLGSAEGKLWKGWGYGTLLQLPVLMTLWLVWLDIGQGNVVVIVPSLIAIVYGVTLLIITQRRVLDKVVPPEIADQVRREKRRAARGHATASTKARPGPVALRADDSEE